MGTAMGTLDGVLKMGMFDSLYSERGSDVEWQTKAYGCSLERLYVGDLMPEGDTGGADTYQVEVLGGAEGEFRTAYATVVAGRLVSVGDEQRLPRLPLVHRFGGLIEVGDEFRP